jgi:hypothetical protein
MARKPPDAEAHTSLKPYLEFLFDFMYVTLRLTDSEEMIATGMFLIVEVVNNLARVCSLASYP